MFQIESYEPLFSYTLIIDVCVWSDAGGRRNSAPDKENEASQVSDKSVKPSSVPTIEANNTSRCY